MASQALIASPRIARQTLVRQFAAPGPAVALHGAEQYAVLPAEAPMLFGFINRISSANQLKENLDLSSQRTRGIAQRVAGATLQNQAGFAMPNGEVVSKPESVNLEAEMTSLADEQLRYEATEKLLEKAYQQIRVSMRNT